MNECFLWAAFYALLYLILAPIFAGLAYRWTVIFPANEDESRAFIAVMWGLFWPAMIIYCLVNGFCLFLGIIFLWVSGYEPPTEKDKK